MHGAKHRRLVLGMVFGMGVCSALFTGGGSNPTIDTAPSVAAPWVAAPLATAPVAAAPLATASLDPAAPAAETGRIPAGRDPLSPPERTILRVYCCPTAHRAFAAGIETLFETAHHGIDLQLTIRADRDCVGHVMMKRGDIAVISTTLSPNERASGLRDQVLAHHIVVPIVHASNQVGSITPAELESLRSGECRSWLALGGADVEVQPVCEHSGRLDDRADRDSRGHEESGGHGHSAATPVFMDDPRGVLAYVATHRGAFGLVDLVHAAGLRDVRTLRICNTHASAEALENGLWPLGSTIRVVTGDVPNGAVRAFLGTLQSDAVRRHLRREFTAPTNWPAKR